MMRLDESSLETVEPYHIPGYCGYCPQFKYKIEETFGKTSHKLLTADGISRSRRPVLAPLDGARSASKKGEERKSNFMAMRERNIGDHKYCGQMVPGYTGYIPKGQHYYGDRYALYSRNAISHMEQDHQVYNKQRHDTLICSEGNGRYKTPLKPKLRKTRMYFPNVKQHSLSPYTLANDDPRKYMMSGYTGFVPTSRGMIGAGYPNVTNKALVQFTNVCADTKANIRPPVVLDRSTVRCQNNNPIYYQDSGMVPHYTGHVPGEKFRYGKTFGHSTTNAVQKAK